MKRYKDGNNINCYSTEKYHFTIPKNRDWEKPVLLESILGCGYITRIHAAYLLREVKNDTVIV